MTAFNDIPETGNLASLPFVKNTKSSVYLLSAWLKVYAVSTHVIILLFPLILINFLSHSPEVMFVFTWYSSHLYTVLEFMTSEA